MLYLYSKLRNKSMDRIAFSSNHIIRKDNIDLYFECISECNIVNGHKECIIHCLETHLKKET